MEKMKITKQNRHRLSSKVELDPAGEIMLCSFGAPLCLVCCILTDVHVASLRDMRRMLPGTNG